MTQDSIWEAYQNDPSLQSMGCRDGGRTPFIARQVAQGTCTLNIGVGRGALEELLLKRGVDVHSLDPSETSIQGLKGRLLLGGKARVGHSQSIPFPDASFDCVVMAEVLEHLADEVLEETREEVWRVLVSGGVFIGSVPADENLTDNIVVCPQCGEKFHRWGHQQSFSQSDLCAFLSEGFDEVSVKRKAFSQFSALNWKGKLVALARKLQAELGRKGSNQNFFFRAKKI